MTKNPKTIIKTKTITINTLEMQNDSPVYKARREKMAQWMQGEGVDLVMFSDFEEGRDCAVRWLSGMPQDALYFLDKNGRSVLMPWDINMAAECKACAELIFPYNEVSRSSILAMKAAASYLKLKHGAKVEIPSSTPYYKFLQYVDEAGEYDIRCRKEGAQQESARLRAVKDDAEIAIIKEGSAITNEIIALVENGVKIGELKTEVDVALFIDREGRKRGCEGMGFETLAAGPKRSFGIHAFPSFTGGEFGTEGLSLVDFGLIHKGYTSDVTMSFARGPLTPAQQELVDLVKTGYQTAMDTANAGIAQYKKARESQIKKFDAMRQEKGDDAVEESQYDLVRNFYYPVAEVAKTVDKVFKKGKRVMPHTLGHGIGLECHESPRLSAAQDNDWTLRPGMIVTLEPGLYDAEAGGVRWENDFLVRDDGIEQLTQSVIVEL